MSVVIRPSLVSLVLPTRDRGLLLGVTLRLGQWLVPLVMIVDIRVSQVYTHAYSHIYSTFIHYHTYACMASHTHTCIVCTHAPITNTQMYIITFPPLHIHCTHVHVVSLPTHTLTHTHTLGQPSWGIAWYINGILIPELVVERGSTYTFIVEGGDNPSAESAYHPLYITDSITGSRISDPTIRNVSIIVGKCDCNLVLEIYVCVTVWILVRVCECWCACVTVWACVTFGQWYCVCESECDCVCMWV